MIYTFDEIKKVVTPIAKSHGVKTLSLFGSYAKGLQNEKSDLDFMIESGDIDSYFKYISFVNELEKVFQCHVDVITEGIEDKNFLKNINKDKLVVYDRER